MRLPNLFLLFFLFLIQFSGSLKVYAQTNSNSISYLEKLVSINAKNNTIDEVFDNLSKQCGCYFTYDATLINGKSRVSFSFRDSKLKFVLDSMLNNPNLSYHIVDNQLVIRPLLEKLVKDSMHVSDFLYATGTILSNTTKETLPFVSIAVKNKFIGGISNQFGQFNLKIPLIYKLDTLVFSYMGFYNLEIPIFEFPKDGQILLTEGLISIQEVIVRSKDPLFIIHKAKEAIHNNYRLEAYNYTAFYREAIKSNNKYSVYSEALISGYKPPLRNNNENDMVELQKARKYTSVKPTDTLMVKLRGGMEACFQLDIIHKIPDFLSDEGEDFYSYHLNDMVIWHNELVYVIGFKQNSNIVEPMLEGQVYINTTDFSILGAEFFFSPQKLKQSDKLFVIRKSMNTNVKPIYTKYKVSYVPINNKYYVQYVRGELVLSAKKNRQLFHRNFSTMMEMIYTGMDTLNVEKPTKKNLFETQTIFSDSKYVYDDNFWKQQNIIIPEENIMDAFKKSGFQISKQESSNN